MVWFTLLSLSDGFLLISDFLFNVTDSLAVCCVKTPDVFALCMICFMCCVLSQISVGTGYEIWLCHLFLCVSCFPFWYWGYDVGCDCTNSWPSPFYLLSLITNVIEFACENTLLKFQDFLCCLYSDIFAIWHSLFHPHEILTDFVVLYWTFQDICGYVYGCTVLFAILLSVSKVMCWAIILFLGVFIFLLNIGSCQ